MRATRRRLRPPILGTDDEPQPGPWPPELFEQAASPRAAAPVVHWPSARSVAEGQAEAVAERPIAARPESPPAQAERSAAAAPVGVMGSPASDPGSGAEPGQALALQAPTPRATRPARRRQGAAPAPLEKPTSGGGVRRGA